MRMYSEQDVNPSILKDKKIVILGYGRCNQPTDRAIQGAQ